jgi:hypothetical protein
MNEKDSLAIPLFVWTFMPGPMTTIDNHLKEMAVKFQLSIIHNLFKFTQIIYNFQGVCTIR